MFGETWSVFRIRALPDAACRLLRAQAGVITHAQLLTTGLTKHQIANRACEWLRPARGVFIVGEPTGEAALQVAALIAGPDGAIGGEAAAHLAGVVRDVPKRIVAFSPSAKAGVVVGDHVVVFRRGTRCPVGSPPRSKLEASLVDMAADADERAIIDAVARALVQRMTTVDRLSAELRSRTRVRGRGLLKALLLRANQGVESVLEWLFLRDVVRAHGLPEPSRQVRTGHGRLDNLYEPWRLVVELDGERDHADWSRDMLRDNEHLLDDGRTTLRYGMNAVLGKACQVAAQIGRGLTARGWPGSLGTCPTCAARSR